MDSSISKFKFNNSEIKDDIFILIIMVITIPLTGELKIYPFQNTFRISFSTTIFLFLLLWIKKIPLILCGSCVGVSVVFFRIILDIIFQNNFSFYNAFLVNFPAFFYYFIFSSIFYIVSVNRLHNYPMHLGFIAVISDMTSSIFEIILRHIIFKNTIISPLTIFLLLIIAIIRSFFVLGFFNIIKLNEIKEKAKQQAEQNKYMLLLISNLYEEAVQLKKSLTYAEDITTKCYNLYRKSKDPSHNFNDIKIFSENLLEIAGEIHEIKKDNQRIYSGLSKIISSKNHKDYMNPLNIVSIVIETNKKYSSFTNKNIKFEHEVDITIPPLHVYTMLSILNNLVSNSIEAIPETGKIKIVINKIDSITLEIKVYDNGPGIPLKRQHLIFKPGYTTKYDKTGKASNGMGLAYVSHLINALNGSISVNSNTKETIFTIKLSIDKLIKEG